MHYDVWPPVVRHKRVRRCPSGVQHDVLRMMFRCAHLVSDGDQTMQRLRSTFRSRLESNRHRCRRTKEPVHVDTCHGTCPFDPKTVLKEGAVRLLVRRFRPKRVCHCRNKDFLRQRSKVHHNGGRGLQAPSHHFAEGFREPQTGDRGAAFPIGVHHRLLLYRWSARRC